MPLQPTTESHELQPLARALAAAIEPRGEGVHVPEVALRLARVPLHSSGDEELRDVIAVAVRIDRVLGPKGRDAVQALTSLVLEVLQARGSSVDQLMSSGSKQLSTLLGTTTPLRAPRPEQSRATTQARRGLRKFCAVPAAGS